MADELTDALLGLYLLTVNAAVPFAALRHPAGDRSAFVGSTGATIVWQSPEGVGVVELLAGPQPSPEDRFDFDTRVAEVRGRVASFFEASLASGEADDIIRAHAAELAASLADDVAGEAWRFIAGIAPPNVEFAIAPGVSWLPTSDPRVQAHLAAVSQRDLSDLPGDLSGVLIARWIQSRVGSLVPTLDAGLQAEFVLRDVATAIWLATGRRPRRIVGWFGETGSFPAFPSTPEWAPPWERHTDNDVTQARRVEPDAVRDMFWRVRERPWMDLFDTSFDEETAVALRSAFFQVDAADRAVDGAQVLVNAYATLEGLLTNREDDNQVVARGTVLLGSTTKTRQELTRRLDACRDLRNDIAHGRRPLWDTMVKVVGFTGDPTNILERHLVDVELRRLAREILRCAFGCVLLLATRIEPARSTPIVQAMSKRDIVEVLVDARSKDLKTRAAAEQLLQTKLPLWIRDPFGRLPDKGT